MVRDTITFELGSEVDLAKLFDGIKHFKSLVEAITENANVEWLVEDLQAGSARATLRGKAQDQSQVERVVDQYNQVGNALEGHGSLIEFPYRVQEAASHIQRFAGTVDYVLLETISASHTISGNGASIDKPTDSWTSLGEITGQVQLITNRGNLRFSLYDALFNKAITCYLRAGQEAMMRKAWDRQVVVFGNITRIGPLGRPVSIRDIKDIEVLESPISGAYRKARGAIPWKEGDMLPEDAIRALRDG